MQGTSGGTALVLVTMLLAQMKARGEVDLDQMEQSLRLLLGREISDEQLTDATNALAVVQGLKGIPTV
jgi:hypothetical protein